MKRYKLQDTGYDDFDYQMIEVETGKLGERDVEYVRYEDAQKWQKMQWPLPPEILSTLRDGQYALYYYGTLEGSIALMYWDAEIQDFRYNSDVAHIYGGTEPTEFMLIEPPSSAVAR